MDLSDIPRIRGPLKYVAYVGVLVMMGGLGLFAFGLLSMLADFDPDNIPTGFPPYAIYGFGVAAVGAILVTLALAMGPKESEFSIHGDVIHGDVFRDVRGNIVTRPSGPVDARSYNVTINQQRTYVGRIDQAVRSLPMRESTRRDAEDAIDDVGRAVEGQDQWEISNALTRLTGILNEAGAFATAGSAASRAIVDLAGTLGGYGQNLLHWFAGA